MNLRNFYKDDKCPACGKVLIFNYNYKKVNCKDIDCSFNKNIVFSEYVAKLNQDNNYTA